MDRPPLELRFIGHSTVLIEIGGIRILTDPFLRSGLGPLVRHGAPPDVEALGEVDIVVISHGHADHFDLASLGALAGRPVVVVPRRLGSRARRAVRGEVIEMTADERVDLAGVAVTAVRARHWITPGAPRAHPLGYLFDTGTRIYFAGDTGRFPAMRRLAGSVDVALLPVWTWGPHLGPGHLGPRSAAEVARDIEAKVVLPIHWGTLYPRQLHRVWSGPLAEPGDRFAAHAARLAPEIDVRVLRPGERTTIRLQP